jgi:hypothetical protein
MLRHAFICAQDAGADVWDFAVEIAALYETGLTISDLRWLVAKRFADHGQESTGYDCPHRAFRPGAGYLFQTTTCVVLTPCGAEFANHFLNDSATSSQSSVSIESAPLGGGRTAGLEREPQVAANLNGSPSAASKPCWDSSRRELSLDGMVVKRFRVPAQTQELILRAFQEDGWPEHIDDPLPGSGAIDARTRLHDAIHRLNGHQANRLIRFSGNGNGTGVCWERYRSIELRQPAVAHAAHR